MRARTRAKISEESAAASRAAMPWLRSAGRWAILCTLPDCHVTRRVKQGATSLTELGRLSGLRYRSGDFVTLSVREARQVDSGRLGHGMYTPTLGFRRVTMGGRSPKQSLERGESSEPRALSHGGGTRKIRLGLETLRLAKGEKRRPRRISPELVGLSGFANAIRISFPVDGERAGIAREAWSSIVPITPCFRGTIRCDRRHYQGKAAGWRQDIWAKGSGPHHGLW